MPGQAGLTPHIPWLSQAHGKRKMRGFSGEDRQERKEVRLGSEGGTRVDREGRADGPCLPRVKSWLVKKKKELARPLLWTRSHFIFCPYIVQGPLVPLLCDLRPTPHPLWPSPYRESQ